MKIYGIITALSFVFWTVAAFGQPLRPTEIVYSRLPGNVNLPPQGSNQPTIWAVGQDGANDRFITNGTMPRVSDDGRFLIFKRYTRFGSSYNGFGGLADIYVRELATGQETLIRSLNFDNDTGTLSYTPESNIGASQIVISQDCFMFSFNRDGTNNFRFPWANAAYCYDDFPSIRRGGDQLIAFSNSTVAPNAGGLYTVGIAGANRQKIPNTSCLDFGPAWSNDNQFIAAGILFQNCSDNYPSLNFYPYWIANIFKIKPDGTGRQQLTSFPAAPDCSQPNASCFSPGFVWTEDNSRIIAAGKIGGVRGLFAFNAAGSGAFSQIPISPGNPPEYVGSIVPPRVDRNVISIGGGPAAAGQFSLVATIGEPLAGQTSAAGSYSLTSGFWAAESSLRRTPFDFDGDGKTDIGIFRAGDGSWWYNRSGAGGFSVFSFGTGTDLLTPGDWTGDGKADLSVFRPSNGFWFVQRSEDNSFFSFPFGTSGDIPAPADFDGDGKTDAAVFRPSSGTWFVLNSGSGQTAIVQFGASGDRPVAADYDGDGRADIAIWRPSDGSWWYLPSTTGAFRVFRFGLGTDKPVPGDFTGDGRADIAVFRPTTGEWFVQRSEDGSFYSVPFGANGDVPAPGDYDGDGRFDTAVFRPAAGNWFVQRSTAGTLIASFGAAGDRPIPNAFVP